MYSSTAARVAARYLTLPKKMLIGGQWVFAVSGETLDLENPATAQVITTVPVSGSQDILAPGWLDPRTSAWSARCTAPVSILSANRSAWSVAVEKGRGTRAMCYSITT
jgi:hypothetical protein